MPYSPYGNNQNTSKNTTQGFIFGLLILGLIAFFAANHIGLFDAGPNNNEGTTVVVDDDQKQDDDQQDQAVTSDLSNSLLLVIRDKRQINEDIGYAQTMMDDTFWMEVVTKVKDLEIVSPNDDVVVDFLSRNSLTPPVVCLVDTKTKTVQWQIPLPKGGTDPIREKLFK